MQDDFTGQTLAAEVIALLEPERNARMRAELREVMKRIGEPGASQRAAQAILNFLATVSTGAIGIE
jgi:lipid A disaccharide synthetase